MQPGECPPVADGHQVATAVDELAVAPGVELQFRAFFTDQFPLLVKFVMLCGASLDEAQDAAQEAFIAVWHELGRGRWQEVANPEGWIRRVAIRQHGRTQRRDRRLPIVPLPDLPDLEQPGLSTVDLTEETLEVMEALSALDPVLRAVIVYKMAGFTAAETGQELGLTEQKVRDQRKKAGRKLAKRFGGRKKQKGEQA
jgi:RNA polymerase sigma factor (sigma-70 family)